MTILMSGRETRVDLSKVAAAFAHILKFGSIVAVSWACAAPASSDEIPEPPPVMSLNPADNQTFLEPILEFLRTQGYQKADKVDVVVIAYTEGDTDKLIAFKFDGSPVGEPKEYKRGDMMIPEAGADFENAIILYTASEAKTKSCTGPGGTPYCNFPP